jgi:iron(III) transport system substrate-binding protein
MEHCHLPLRPLSADSSIPQRQRHEGRGMIRSILLICTLALAPAMARAADPTVIEAARQEGSLAVADTAPGENFQKFMAAFKVKYPFLDIATGFYSAPTGRVLARVNAEIDARRLSFDVMLAANTAAWIEMTEQGRIARYDSPEYAAFAASAKMDGYWAAAQAIGVIPVYNKNTLPAGVAPKSWLDLLRPEFSDHKLAIQNAAAGTQFNWNYLLEHALGPDFTRKFAAQSPVVMATGAQLTDAVTRGEVVIAAALDHWRAFTPEAIQAGLVAAYPAEGMPVTLAPVGILAGAPHPNAAKLFIEFILSQEGQRLLDTELYGMYSMRSDVPPPAGQKPLAETHPLLPPDAHDYVQASRDFPRHFEDLFH